MLEGDLTDFELPDILKLLAATHKTGRLYVRDDQVLGRVDLADGRVRDASADAARLSLARRLLGAGLVDTDDLHASLKHQDLEVLPTDLELARHLVTDGAVEAASLAELVREQTVDALFDILRWRRGRFRFDGDADVGDTGADGGAVLDLSIKVDDLLGDATARLDDWQAIFDATGPGDAVVSIVRPDADEEVGLPADAWSLLTLVDGNRTVDELVALTGRGQFRTRSLLRTLVDRGVVRAGAPDGRGPVARLLAAHEQLAELERRLSGGHAADAPVGSDGPAPLREVPAPAATSPSTSQGFDLSELEALTTAEPPSADQPPADAPSADAPSADAPSGDAPSARAAHAPHRLQTDPQVDPTLVRRLIQGVEEL